MKGDLMRCLISADIVAAKLGRSLSWFKANKTRLISEEGFPPPLAAVGNVWDETLIDRWFDRIAGISAPSCIDPSEAARVEYDVSARMAELFPFAQTKEKKHA